jgi:hypothetical protein
MHAVIVVVVVEPTERVGLGPHRLDRFCVV